MATLGERVATVEARLTDLTTDVRELRNVVEGGGDVEYERSVRGRLHTVEKTVAGFVLRRNFGAGFGKAWVQSVLVASAVATAAAAWYAALGH